MSRGLDGNTWQRLIDETKRFLMRERLPEADAEDLASELVIEARNKESPKAWLHKVRPLRAADWHRQKIRTGVSVAETKISAPKADARPKTRRLSTAQRDVLRRWLDVVTGGLDELWAFYAGAGEAAPMNVAEELRRRHERVLAGRSSVDVDALLPLLGRYDIPADFDSIMAAEIRRLLDTGEGRWIESGEHHLTPRRGRPPREAQLSVRAVWQHRRASAMSDVVRAAVRLVAPAISAAFMNDLAKGEAAAHRVEIKRLAKIYVAVRDGKPIPKRGRPKKR
jgi:DNA-directed RNA polymerase specialized sigma24 family protein